MQICDLENIVFEMIFKNCVFQMWENGTEKLLKMIIIKNGNK